MTQIQLIHHMEQMDAMRAEFNLIWPRIEERAEHFLARKLTEDEWHLQIDLAWQAFKAGKS